MTRTTNNSTVIMAIATIILALMLAACGQEEPPIETGLTYIPYTNDELGVTLSYPEDWVVHNAFGGLTVASSQTVIDGDSLADMGDNGFVLIIPGELGVFNMQTKQQFTDADALQILGVYKQLLEREGQSHLGIEPPQTLTIDGQPAAMMVSRSAEDGKNLIVILAVIMNDDFMALVSAVSLEPAAAEMRPIFEEIINSIHISVPAGLE